MTKAIPHVQKYMTPTPLSIGVDQSLTQAHATMRSHGVRHLPVLSGGKLKGLLSDRDLHLIETLRDVDPDSVTVEEAMTPVVYSVSPDAPLDTVASEMASHKYGCAVVEQNGKVVGVFTTTDALHALVDLLGKRFHG